MDIPRAEEAAKQLRIPAWGKVLIWALVGAGTILAGLAWAGYKRLGNIDSTLAVLVSGQDQKTKDLIRNLQASLDSKQAIFQQKVSSKLDASKLDIDKRINALTSDIRDSNGRNVELESRVARLQAINRLNDPARVLATIRAELSLAQSGNRILPVADLADYRKAVKALPADAHEYWATVAAIINYQSLAGCGKTAREGRNLPPTVACGLG